MRKPSWNFWTLLILGSFGLLQAARWPLFPHFVDGYYHLLTAQGFIQAGGYSSWDFWQYAPVGRIHFYPPFFHFLLVLGIQSGLDKIFLLKFWEFIMPVLFLGTLAYFFRKNYSQRFAFFVLLTAGSSFSFYLSLINHVPATLALVLGFFALDRLLSRQFLRAAILLALCFYTHIGVSWYMALSLVVYGILEKEFRKPAILTLGAALAMSFPMLSSQWESVTRISLSGIGERYSYEFKIIEYALAFLAFMFIRREKEKYRLEVSLFAASIVFLLYPNRFFYNEGYLPVILLSALSLCALHQKFRGHRLYRRAAVAAGAFVFFFSPTVLVERTPPDFQLKSKVYFADSAFANLIRPGRNERVSAYSLWFPRQYLPAAALIQRHSQENDIICSNLHNMGVCLASLAGRATANALLPEVKAAQPFDQIAVSKIIVLTQGEEEKKLEALVERYHLRRIGENQFFIFYENPDCSAKVNVRRKVVSFGWVAVMFFTGALVFILGTRIEKRLLLTFFSH